MAYTTPEEQLDGDATKPSPADDDVGSPSLKRQRDSRRCAAAECGDQLQYAAV